MKTLKTRRLKLYWSQSKLAWLSGINPFKSPELTKPTIPAVEQLCQRLLSIGGEKTCVPFEEPRLLCNIIATGGQMMWATKVKLQRGEPSSCHWNVARIWKRNKKKFTIFTGFALCHDQMWRRHSWLRDTKGQIIETTVKPQGYFGIPCEGDGAEFFCEVCHI